MTSGKFIMKFVKLAKAGFFAKEIAEKMNLHHDSVLRRAKRYSLPIVHAYSHYKCGHTTALENTLFAIKPDGSYQRHCKVCNIGMAKPKK